MAQSTPPLERYASGVPRGGFIRRVQIKKTMRSADRALDCPRAGDEPSSTAQTSRAPTRASAMGVSPHDYSVREKRLVSFFGKQVNSRKVSEPSFGFGTGTREETEVRPLDPPPAE